METLADDVLRTDQDKFVENLKLIAELGFLRRPSDSLNAMEPFLNVLTNLEQSRETGLAKSISELKVEVASLREEIREQRRVLENLASCVDDYIRIISSLPQSVKSSETINNVANSDLNKVLEKMITLKILEDFSKRISYKNTLNQKKK